ncbi:MAG: hypothetical protein EOM20_03470 [Spartobacteria bacterium]|nr:hypothetical protein [Spartobacteria bacterium]
MPSPRMRATAQKTTKIHKKQPKMAVFTVFSVTMAHFRANFWHFSPKPAVFRHFLPFYRSQRLFSSTLRLSASTFKFF